MEDIVTNISGLDTMWVLVAAFLVFFMQAGFALLEAGFTQSKNAVNIIMKNLLDVSFGTLAFFVVGFAFMFGSGSGFIGMDMFFLNGISDVWPDTTIPTLVFFLFQCVFAATAATIVSGALAERTKFRSYVVFSMILTGIIYPIVGHWTWGGGWLGKLGFTDFAGSTIVHSVGGWAALAGIIVIGSRMGRFDSGSHSQRFSGHSIPLAALGAFILWFGWFGFNPGSQLGIEGAENAKAVALIAINTQLAGAAGAIGALLYGYYRSKVAKVGNVINGALGGLVAITAPCAFVTPLASVFIGLIGGVVVVKGSSLLEKLMIDDAVGAVPVHLGAGIWGTLAVGIFSQEQGLLYGKGFELLGIQFYGVIAVGIFTFVSSLFVFKLLDHYLVMRASEEEERVGLDYKHGQAAYLD